MAEQSTKVGILLTGRNDDMGFINQIIEKLKEYPSLLEFVEEGKEKLRLDISLMSPLKSNLDEEVEFIVSTAIGIKKYERVRDRTIKKAGYEARKKLGLTNRKNIN